MLNNNSYFNNSSKKSKGKKEWCESVLRPQLFGSIHSNNTVYKRLATYRVLVIFIRRLRVSRTIWDLFVATTHNKVGCRHEPHLFLSTLLSVRVDCYVRARTHVGSLSSETITLVFSSTCSEKKLQQDFTLVYSNSLPQCAPVIRSIPITDY